VKNSLFGLAERITGLRDSVADKRAEAERIKRSQRLFSIVGNQVRKTGYILLSELFGTGVCVVFGFISDLREMCHHPI
jgi:hypothetical protein